MTDQTRVKELTNALNLEVKSLNEALTGGVTIEGKNVDVDPDAYADIRKSRDNINEIKALLLDEYAGTEIKSFIAGLGGTPEDAQSVAMRMAAGAQGGMQIKSLGEAFVGSTEFKDLRTSGRLTMDSPFMVEGQQDVSSLGTYGQKDIFSGMAGAQHQINHGFGRIQFDPMVPRGQRPTRVRDLFPVATTNANLIDFFRVMGYAVGEGEGGNAAPVADRDGNTFGLKPKSNLRFESAQAPVRTIAHWEAAHRNVLADEPQLQSTINNELLYGLALEEDDQIINGDGTGENLLGILNVDGTQSYTQANTGGTTPTELKSDALRRAATLAILANYPPTGYVLHPHDWEDIELQKGGMPGSQGDGDGQYMLVTNISVGAQQRVWRQPVVESPAMPEGTFITGAWGTGAQLYDRQQANVRIAEQHADFFVRNAVAILVEERLAFAVKRPESFVIGSFIG